MSTEAIRRRSTGPRAGLGKGPRRIFRLGVAGGVGLAVVTVLAIGARTYHAQAVERAYWLPAGPPCPVSSPAQIAARRFPLQQSFAFQGVQFARNAGWASCSGVAETLLPLHRSFYVCQFTSPIVLSASAGGQTRYYFLGPARPATITYRRGVLSCVAASNYRAVL